MLPSGTLHLEDFECGDSFSSPLNSNGKYHFPNKLTQSAGDTTEANNHVNIVQTDSSPIKLIADEQTQSDSKMALMKACNDCFFGAEAWDRRFVLAERIKHINNSSSCMSMMNGLKNDGENVQHVIVADVLQAYHDYFVATLNSHEFIASNSSPSSTEFICQELLKLAEQEARSYWNYGAEGMDETDIEVHLFNLSKTKNRGSYYYHIFALF